MRLEHVSTKRERDRAEIRAVVRRFGPLSRVDIHTLTRLRPGTISALVRELLQEGQLLEAGPSNNPMGRKQVLLHLNEKYGFVLGIEFDAEIVVAAITDLRPKVKVVLREPIHLEGGTDGLTQQLLGCARRVIQQAGIERSSLVGIAVADPGLVDTRRGVSVGSSVIDFWKEVPLEAIFRKEFDAPFLLESNTRARTVAERLLGAGEMVEDMVYVDYGTGIGAGIISQGMLFRGHRESAGELGHTHVIENGPSCKCGSFGCLEAIAGEPSLGAQARRAILEGGSSQALALAEGDPEKITGWTVLQAAKSGDKMCGALVEELENYLGLALANVVNLFNPALIVLDKRLEMAGVGLLEHVARIVRRQALRHSTEELVFRFGKMGDEAGAVGAALLFLEQLFQIPVLKPPKVIVEPRVQSFRERVPAKEEAQLEG